MSLRNLMKQRKAESRISHPCAKYDVKGQLHCTVCESVLIKHDQLWPAHLTSKTHRTNVQLDQQKREESKKRALEAEEEALRAKRARLEEEQQQQEEQDEAFLQELDQAAAEDDDPEWAEFERAVLAEPPAPAGAFISSEAKLFTEGQAEEEETADVPPADDEQANPEETEEERKQREENEELMQRIEDEEQEQQDADQRVVALKARLEAIRRAKAAAKA